MAASVTLISFGLNFSVNAILIRYCSPQAFEICHISKRLLAMLT